MNRRRVTVIKQGARAKALLPCVEKTQLIPQHIPEGTCRSSTRISRPGRERGPRGLVATSTLPASGRLDGGPVRRKVLGRSQSLFTAPYTHLMCNVITEVFGFSCTFLIVPSDSYVFVMVSFIFQLDCVPG